LAVPLFPGKAALASCYPPSVFLDAIRANGWSPGRVPRSILFTYQRFESYLATVPEQYTPNPMLGSRPGTFFLVNETDGDVGVNCLGIGAPNAVNQLTLQAALGAERFLSIGTAGGLQPNMAPGDVVVATEALRDEGASYHFLPPDQAALPSHAFSNHVSSSLENAGLRLGRGTTWTTDVPFRETAEEVRYYRNAGVHTVEMEAAAVFAAGSAIGVDTAAAFVVDSVASDDGSYWMVDLPTAVTQLQHLFGACIGALAELS
jgi:uridine phosphorylase